MLRADRIASRKRRRRSRSQKASRPKATVEIADYRHKAEKRKNNPDAGLASYNYRPQVRVSYSYDPHLDPQLIWAGKTERTSFDVETVSLHIHERVSTQAILKSVQRAKQWKQEKLFAEPELPLDRRIEFYQHEMDWANRLILGDSLLVMNSLLERELMAGKVQMIYVDPPYGIAYNSNFQPHVTSRDVKDRRDDSLTREPEQIKAYRDTWRLGIHSYLTYLRDRLLLCRDLLHESGSIFVQINDENIHRVRLLMDEIFEPENFVSMIGFVRAGAQTAQILPSVSDYLLWYARDKTHCKSYKLLLKDGGWAARALDIWVEYADGRRERWRRGSELPKGARLFTHRKLESATGGESSRFPITLPDEDGTLREFRPVRGWSTNQEGVRRLIEARRLMIAGKAVRFIVYLDDFPFSVLTNSWTDTATGQFTEPKIYVVQTGEKIVTRCILMTTDPGDLVFDPTCGSGTTAYCAERWGRRWITCDTSRVALAVARQRLMTAVFPFFSLANAEKGVDGGFQYETVPRVTLGSIARNEAPQIQILYDSSFIERDKVRISGPFTVEAIPVPTVAEISEPSAEISHSIDFAADHVNTMIELLRKDGVTFPNGSKMTIDNLRPISSAGFIHAEGEANQNGERIRVAFSLGPRYGPVTAKQVDEAIRSSYRLGFDVLVLTGFAFDPEAQATIQKNPIPKLKVHLASVSPDVIVGDLLKTTRGSQLFTVFGQPDIKVEKGAEGLVVKLLGVDIYDPVTGEVHSASADEVPAWFLDEDYDGYTFRICQAFFPKEASAENPWDKLEKALRGVIDKEKMSMFRGTESLPFEGGSEKRIGVKVIDNRGNEVVVVKLLENRGK